MRRAALSALAGSEPETPAWIGLYRVRGITTTNDGVVCFETARGFVFEEWGFAFSETPLSTGIRVNGFVYRELNSPWYLYEWSD